MRIYTRIRACPQKSFGKMCITLCGIRVYLKNHPVQHDFPKNGNADTGYFFAFFQTNYL